MAKLTKNCLYPWNFLQLHAGGMIQCCPVGNDTDMGDFIIDHCEKEARGESSDILNFPAIVRLREGLLTGNLRPMCRRCFFVDDNLTTTEQLKASIKNHLKRRLPAGTDIDALDLARTYAYSEMAVSFTNRCNLRCVYCVQSTQARINPFFSMDFPVEYVESTLDFFAKQGISMLRSCVEGEGTIYKNWYSCFSAFQKKYPHIGLRMTTNLARRFTDEEIDLLAHYRLLDVSCDTLDPELYAKLRRGGKLSQVLENIEKIRSRARELGIQGPLFSLHAVVSDITWPTLEELVDYCFANGMLIVLGNYEERANALSYQEKICRPITAMPIEEQDKARQLFLRTKKELERLGYDAAEMVQGGLIHNTSNNVNRNYNRFAPYDDNPLHKAFHHRYPRGQENMHLDILYDYDNLAYSGVLFSGKNLSLRLDGLDARHMVIREVSVYDPGTHSAKYDQTVLPGYRKIMDIENGVFEYTPSFASDVGKVLLEVSEHW